MASKGASSATGWKIITGIPWLVGIVVIVAFFFTTGWIYFTGNSIVYRLSSSGWYAAIMYVPPASGNNTVGADPFSGFSLMYVDSGSFSDVDHAHVWDLFERTRDSLKQEKQFVRGLPAGSIEKVEKEDSVALILRYNLDCQCDQQYEVMLFSVNLTDSVPSIADVTTRKEPFLGAHQRNQILEGGGEKLAQTD